MKKKELLLGLILTAAAVLGFLLIADGPSRVLAHNINVNGFIADWTMTAPATANLGHIARNSSYGGEYVWADSSSDVRSQGTDPDSNYEMTEFRVTADSNNIYFLAQFSDITNPALPHLAIAVDTDQVDGSGVASFLDATETQTASTAEWERLVVVNSNKTGYFDTSLGWTSHGAASISAANDVIELGMALANMGISPPAFVRFSVIVGEHNGSGVTREVAAGSDVLDAVTNYGDPGTALNTSSEVSDGVVDYYFDVFFNPGSEPSAPLLITEINVSPLVANGEWVQLFNPFQSPLSLDGWKLGTAETVDESGEDMYEFPTGNTVASSDSVIVAEDADVFDANYSCNADFDVDITNGTSDMQQYSAWATGSWDLAYPDDELLLVDPCDTIVDVAVWGAGSYPGVTAHAAPASGETLERYFVNTDTDDCSADFRVQGSGGSPCNAPTVVELTDFDASSRGRSIFLTWETASEIDLVGFNLYRGTQERGPYVQVNDSLIMAQHPGSLLGAVYTWQDTGLRLGRRYYYKLEQLDVQGATATHGPVSAILYRRIRPAPAPSPIPVFPVLGYREAMER